MKATDLLKKQHREVKTLFKNVEKTESASERRKFLDQIGTALTGHATIEEELFYPAVRDLGTTKAGEMVAEALEEHHVVKLVLRELPRLDPKDDRFEAKMTVLSELVEHHADEEEEEMFKAAQKIGDDKLKELGVRMEARYKELVGTRKRTAA
jgi:hemerythrin superfamily protein